MTVLERYTGIDQFGPAYQFMLQNDCHAAGSVDRVLMERMVRVCAETAEHLYGAYTPTKIQYQRGSRAELETHVERAIAGCDTDEERVVAIAGFCSGLGAGASDDLEAMVVGGTEEELIRRRVDWCTEVARVGCVLCQVTGIPARIVYLFNTGRAYSGHAIVEAYRRDAWGAVDTSTNVVYLRSDGAPASTWELVNQPQLIEAHQERTGGFYTTVGQFRAAAISNYFVRDRKSYDYAVSPLNDYYRSILRMSGQRWPGGLRWLHGEDRVPRRFARC